MICHPGINSCVIQPEGNIYTLDLFNMIGFGKCLRYKGLPFIELLEPSDCFFFLKLEGKDISRLQSAVKLHRNDRRVERVGEGGTAEVYRAEHPEHNRCAFKVLRPRLRGEPTAVKRFLREASYGARVQHAGVVRTYDYGEADGLYYLALEWAGGHSLADFLHQNAPLAPADAAVEPLAAAAPDAEPLEAYGPMSGEFGECSWSIDGDGLLRANERRHVVGVDAGGLELKA